MSKSSSSSHANTTTDEEEELRKKAIESLINESTKRQALSERIGSRAFYISRYCPAKADVDFINRHIRRVNGHNKRWEEEKCYSIKKNMERLDNEKRKRSKPVEDKYKAEKEYWKVEKALKFSNNDDDKKKVVEELGVDKSNMFLFPTIASCTSSDEEKKHHHHRHHHHKHHHKS